ncbi:hypothetical protein [Roseicyclus mahoneyensis]|uniref:Uncharacterized protein n=1 Tax=Roseicyclus mahoneyensis TaxID=164332 RepID=A0A316GJV2_9RHOB|nr:hypothetical protein [Roseicyclus mahoneyensis]PWK60906.1 hypothetical protein C7455_103104 [Roseicyclus mahoneyensis]
MKKAPALSIICISLTLAATPVAADSVPLGCFTRAYSAAHLVGQPDQVVAAMWLDLRSDGGSSAYFTLAALMAGQGHAGRDGLGGLVLEEGGFCGSRLRCQVECDGGGFEVTRVQGDMIEITTTGMRVTTEGCSGEALFISDLSEGPGRRTTYRLFRSPDAACARN